MTYHAVREAMARHLLGDAAAHETGRFDEIGRRFDSVERSFPRGDAPELVKLRIALTFWDAWIDARNRGWQPTRGIQAGEWPGLAHGIAEDLLADREISDARARTHFDASTSTVTSDRVQSVAARLRSRDAVG